MAKSKKRLDPNQISIFEIIQDFQEKEKEKQSKPGNFNIDHQFREAISAALKACPLSRYQVVAKMSELVGQDITKTMLDSWTAESKEGHRFPAIFLPAFCDATGQTEPLKLLGHPAGVFILPSAEALRAEIQRIDEDINRKKNEKRKRLLFLREMGEEVNNESD